MNSQKKTWKKGEEKGRKISPWSIFYDLQNTSTKILVSMIAHPWRHATNTCCPLTKWHKGPVTRLDWSRVIGSSLFGWNGPQIYSMAVFHFLVLIFSKMHSYWPIYHCVHNRTCVHNEKRTFFIYLWCSTPHSTVSWYKHNLAISTQSINPLRKTLL